MGYGAASLTIFVVTLQLFGEYMPMVSTDQIGLANASVQQGYATMYAIKVVNPDTCVRGKLVGQFLNFRTPI